jgi:arginyl-tRNA synthetase
MHRYQRAFAELIAAAAGLEPGEVASLIKTPEPGRGDFSLPCFPFARRLRKSPAAVAADIVAALPADGRFDAVEAVGPYVNGRLAAGPFVASQLAEIRALGPGFASTDSGRGQRVVVEYSSPNIAKPLGFHHLRSTMIGNALARIHRALGYEVVTINFLGDWGKTFGLLGAAFEGFGDPARLEEQGISYLLELYLEANRRVAGDPAFDEAARAMFRRQEQGEARALELWRRFREISLAEFRRVYDRLGVAFDSVEGESRYRDELDAVVEEVGRTAGTRIDQGALVVDMEYGPDEPPLMLRKSDGATLYATRDLAAARDRFARFGFAKSLYVVGVEQRQHFELLVRALAAMGCEWAPRVIHVSFGRVQGMSTRRGNVVFLDEVLDEAKERARVKMLEAGEERGIDVDAVSEAVGIGGVVFGDLKNLRNSDYTFDWEEILNPRGFTGICVQYAHARCCSILRKAGGAPGRGDTALLVAPEEIALVKELARIPGAVQDAANDLEPSRLARAVYEAARAWNRYQQAGHADRGLRVLVDDAELRGARLALVDAVRIALARGLDLLGVSAPTAM